MTRVYPTDIALLRFHTASVERGVDSPVRGTPLKVRSWPKSDLHEGPEADPNDKQLSSRTCSEPSGVGCRSGLWKDAKPVPPWERRKDDARVIARRCNQFVKS